MTNFKYEIKKQNQMDGRRWDITETTNRLDVVKALGLPYSPKDAAKQADTGKFRHIRQQVAIRVTTI